MANPEHVAKLREGVEAWNTWRMQNPGIRPDLRGTDLDGTDLSGANLSRVNLGRTNLSRTNLCETDLGGAKLNRVDLHGADLHGMDLRGTYLREANLSRANLSRANLSKVYLGGANLAEAYLSSARLSEADLHKVNLSGAKLNEANLTGAYLSETIFANINLTNVEGLESCFHIGSSIIDHRTLARSGNLPLSFLRGCGLPDTFIDYLPSLLNQPIQHYSCFISYSSKDEAFAQRLHADLQDEGVRCWFAPEDMKIGAKFRVRIDEAIRTYEKLLLLLSEHSVASRWVEKEVETAFEKEDERKEPVLFPIRLDDAVMDSKTGWAADIRRSRHIGDFSNWENYKDYQKGLGRLLRDLKIEKDE